MTTAQPLVVAANVDKYEKIYRGGYNKRYPNLDLVRLEIWYFKRQPGRLLEYAFGTGVNMIHMLESGYEVDGVEASSEAVKLVERKLADRPDIRDKARLHLLDAADTKLPFPDNSFDYVTCLSVLSLLENKERIQQAVDELLRVLKPGGKALIDINGPGSDFAEKGKFVEEDVFEYTLRPDQAEPLRCYCPSSKESFAKLFRGWTVDEIGTVAFEYLGNQSFEWLACLRKPS